MRVEALERATAAIADICRRYRVRELAAFGSIVTGNFRAGSDVDLLVDFLPAANAGYVELFQLQDELASVLGRRVDLVPKQGLSPLIRDDVVSRRQVIYAA